MEDADLPKAFLAHIKVHNRSVFWAICISVIGTLVLWPALYLLAYTLGLLFTSVFVGPSAGLPPAFPIYFVLVVLASFPLCLGVNWIFQRLFPGWLWQHNYFRWMLELLVAPHRLTLSVWGHLGAFCFLSRSEKRAVVQLLRLVDAHRRLEVRRVEIEIPHASRRRRVLEAVSLMDLAHYARMDGRLYLTLHDAEVRKMLYPRVKINKREKKRRGGK